MNTIKAEREVIESEIKDAKFDMSKSPVALVYNLFTLDVSTTTDLAIKLTSLDNRGRKFVCMGVNEGTSTDLET